MFLLKFFITILVISTLLFLKSIFKLSVHKKRVERVLENQSVRKIVDCGTIKSLSILPLVDYYADTDSYETEAGVAYYITADDTDILLDLGANYKKKHPSVLMRNMQTAGKQVRDLDFIYLSHIHLDHVGGMRDQRNKTFSLSAGEVELPNIPVYSPEPVNPSKYNPGPVPVILTEPKKISDGIISIGAIPRALYLMGYTLENSLAFNVEGKGIVVVIGCGHQSIGRILDRVSLLFDEPLYGIIGGLHLPAGSGRMKIGPIDVQSLVGVDRPPWNGINRSDTEVAVAAVKEAAPSFIALSPHDSSDWTIQRFKDEFGEKYHDLKVGLPLNI